MNGEPFCLDQIRLELNMLADEKYRVFQSSLLPGTPNILGVRLPELRRLARVIAAKEDWKSFLAAPAASFEETMLQGMVIGYVKSDVEELLKGVATFVPKIDNWSVCDSFCIGLKFVKDHRECVWEFLQPYFDSNREYEVRFALVTLLDFFITQEYIERVFPVLDSVCQNGYYAKTAVAWAVSMCFVKFPELTGAYLFHNSLDDFTYRKSLQKIVESKSVALSDKQKIRAMKRE
ncbi:MAG TPA: DNA alkylation repair protein [Caproiciproducens sp.]|nr:DNA alkylation repair protein [Caproiciproducens sp.]